MKRNLFRGRRQELLDGSDLAVDTKNEATIELDTASPHDEDDGRVDESRRRLLAAGVGGVVGLIAGSAAKDHTSDVRAARHEKEVLSARDIGYGEGRRDGLVSGERIGLERGATRAYEAILSADSLGNTLTNRHEAPVTLFNGRVVEIGEKSDIEYPFPILLAYRSTDIDEWAPEGRFDLTNQWVGYQQPDGHGGVKIVPMPITPTTIVESFGDQSVIDTSLVFRNKGGLEDAVPSIAQLAGGEFDNPAYPRIISA